jgi:chaperone required for assembly of F1-ATPase
MKRFYRSVTSEPVSGGHGIRLDDKVLKTPGAQALVLPTAALAAAIAEEWSAQEAEIRPAQMKLMRLGATAIDRIPHERAQLTRASLAYAETDLVCYRADHPPALAAEQHAVWQPLVDWAAERYGAPLAVTAGVIPQAQSRASLDALEAALAAADDFTFTALFAATASSGSLVIALALIAGRLDAEAAFAAAELDSSFQIAAWGLDAEAAARRAAIAADLAATARFVTLLRAF